MKKSRFRSYGGLKTCLVAQEKTLFREKGDAAAVEASPSVLNL